ncbi:MAG TPA: DUF1569 domain-containing protein [Acidobacteriaceae bacterium]|nr:DUF1569 domain-containing protein [Acidobacteriaceae bacterium]
MKNLANTAEVAALRARIASLRPADTPRWGSMTAAQTVCHMADSFAGPLGEHPMPPSTASHPPIPRGLYKWLALYFPRKWPQGVPTIPAMNQQIGGTQPAEFEADRALLLDRMDRFVACRQMPSPAHPIFGPMYRKDWMRWGWLHTDHHLRQFGR